MKNKVIDISAPKTAIEFFSGIGLARAGMAKRGLRPFGRTTLIKPSACYTGSNGAGST